MVAARHVSERNFPALTPSKSKAEERHMIYAIQIATHIGECLKMLESTRDCLGLQLKTGEGTFEQLGEEWKAVNLKLSSKTQAASLSHIPIIEKIMKILCQSMVDCNNNYELSETFAFYELSFELLVNLIILFQNIHDSVDVGRNSITAQILSETKKYGVLTLEKLENVYDSLMKIIPTEEYKQPGVSGNLRLYLFEVLIEIFGTTQFKGKDILHLMNYDINGITSLLSFVLSHNGAPFQVQHAASSCLIDLTTANKLFENTSLLHKLGIEDSSSCPLSLLTQKLNQYMDEMILCLLGNEILVSFGKCICQHQMSHLRTDILIQALLSVIRNCLYHSGENHHRFRNHLSMESSLVKDILIPYIDNLLPALQQLGSNALLAVRQKRKLESSTKEGKGKGDTNEVGDMRPERREEVEASEILMRNNLEANNAYISIETASIACFNVLPLRQHILSSGLLSRLLDFESNKGFVCHRNIVDSIVRLMLNCHFGNKEHGLDSLMNAERSEGRKKELLENLMSILSVFSPYEFDQMKALLFEKPKKNFQQTHPVSLVCPHSLVGVCSVFFHEETDQNLREIVKNIQEGTWRLHQDVTPHVQDAGGEMKGKEREREERRIEENKEDRHQYKGGKEEREEKIRKEERAREEKGEWEEVPKSRLNSTTTNNNNGGMNSAMLGNNHVGEKKKNLSDAPLKYRCELDGKLMKNPIRTSQNHFFEKKNLEKWFESCGRVCPITNEELQDHDLIEDLQLGKEIQNWIQDKSSPPQ